VFNLPRAFQPQLATGTGDVGVQGDLAGQAHRFLEFDLYFDIRRGQVLAEGGEGARLVPQAVGDGLGETE